uniref:Uncharacterized protein n=1 Tax=viral metagenome TaxID=1070528 RepID=A0A6M3JBL8_9ZZZZ
MRIQRYEPTEPIIGADVRRCVQELSPETQDKIEGWIEMFKTVHNMGVLSAYELLGALVRYLSARQE